MSIIFTGRGEAGDNEISGGKRNPISPASPLPYNQTTQFNGTVSVSIGVIIQKYKSGTSRKFNAIPGVKNVKIWQINYYDHSIREDKVFARIVGRCNDPLNWENGE
jgi:hypothetical protein